MCWFVLNIFKYILEQNITKFWTYKVFMCTIILNTCFGTLVPKNQTRKIFVLCQNDLTFTKIFELYQVTKWLDIPKRFQMSNCSNNLKLYTSKALLRKNLFLLTQFYFFFLIFWHKRIPPSFRMPCYWH